MTQRRILRAAALIFAVSCAGSFPASAQTASLVRDIGTTGSARSFEIEQILLAEGKTFFTSSSYRPIPWVTDGTQAGTHPLGVHCEDSSCSGEDLEMLGTLRGVLFWNSRRGLWRSDGTHAGTWPLDAPEDGFELSSNGVFFRGAYLSGGCARDTGCGLWRTDGTREGTGRVKEVISPSNFLVAGSRAFFIGLRIDGSANLWVTDGTPGGTREIVSNPLYREAFLPVAAGDKVFFIASSPQDLQMWASDGTAAGTVRLTRFPDLSPSYTPFPSRGKKLWIRAVGRRAYFLADDSVHGLELWRSDGTPAGTQRITDFAAADPFPAFAGQDLFQEVAGGRVVFHADDGLHGLMLWMTDGDPAKTAPLRCSGACPPIPANQDALYSAGTRTVWVATGSNRQKALWGTDGTPGGTAEILPGCSAASCVSAGTLRSWPQGVAFSGFDAAHGQEIWLTDGTRAGTRRLTDLPIDPLFADQLPPAVTDGRKVVLAAPVPGGNGLWLADTAGTHLMTALADDHPSSLPKEIVPFAGGVAFIASPDGDRRELWAAAGNAELALPITLSTPHPFPSAAGLAPAGGLLYFWDWGNSEGRALWRTDGTPQGTLQLTFSGQGLETGVDFQGKLFFPMDEQPPAVWKSDGTPAGTVRAFQATGATAPSISHLTAVGGALYFSAPVEGSTESSLWQSDGTQAGTRRINGPTGLRSGFAVLGSQLFFFAGPNGWPSRLWKTDGTDAGTVPVGGIGSALDSSVLTAYNGLLYFLGSTEEGRSALWRSDGTPAGTLALRELAFEGLDDPLQPALVGFAGKVYFSATDLEHGQELWSTDGTPAGTVIVRDIAPGKRSAGVRHLAAGGGRLWFAADEGVHGAELWQSDGTAAGTRLAQDIAPEGLSSAPELLTVIGDRLWLTADDGATGRELWSLSLAAPGTCHAGPSRLCLGGGRYQVEAAWKTPGAQGRGTAVPLSADTGTFWFFSPANVETIVKVLDGQGLNGHTWVFYGALSNVEYTITVTDTETGLTRRYFNPQGQLASVGDTHGFGPQGASAANPLPPVATAAASPLPLIAERTGRAASVPCQASAQRLCLNNNRFAVEVAWKDFQSHTGKGTAVPLTGGSGETGETGAFWFFDAANIELMVKALDGRPLNDKFWLFYGALSNVEYTLTVTDTATGTIRTYTNPSGRFASVADTEAF